MSHFRDAKAYIQTEDYEAKQEILHQLKDDVLGNQTVPVPGAGVQDTNNPSDPKVPIGLLRHLPSGGQQQEEDPTRSQAFNDAKRDANVPTSAQPDSTAKVPLTDANGQAVINPHTGQPVMTREYTFTTSDGKTIVIQDHSEGHDFPDGGTVKPHFNVRPPENTRHGTVDGTKDHYPYNDEK